MENIEKKDIHKKIIHIQNEWAKNIINIGKAFINKEDYIGITNKFLEELYYFDNGKVLFKPTKASNLQFRKSKNEFISYFIGHNKISEEDKGFALEPWKKIDFENFDYLLLNTIVISMGNYFFTNYENKITKVEYSFGYILNSIGDIKIIFHHSSIPYKI